MKGLRLFLWMVLLTGVLYPLFITLIANVFFKEKAQGSLVYRNEKSVGSKLIAQNFSGPQYFWPRPLSDGASNLGPTSKKLQIDVNKRRTELRALYQTDAIPSDLLFNSASGVDPHISLATALLQIKRISKERHRDEEEIKKIVESLSENTIFKRPYVNVLQLNIELDHDKH